MVATMPAASCIEQLIVSSTAPDNHIRDLYNKKKQPTFSKKRLIVSLMGHLIRAIFHLVKTNQTYLYEIAVSK